MTPAATAASSAPGARARRRRARRAARLGRSSRSPRSRALAGLSPTNTPTSRPASRCRSHEGAIVRELERGGVSAAAARDRGARRDLLSRRQPHPPRRLSAQGALGRLGRARLEGLAASGWSGATCWCRRPASTASRRAGCSPTSIARPLEIRKFEGNPEHPGSRGRNCAKGPATLNQITDPERILYPLKRAGARGEGRWERVTWDEALDDIAGRIRAAIVEGRQNEVMYHVGRPGEDGFTERVLAAWGVDGHNSHTNICSAAARAGYDSGWGIDRPSPDHANAEVILLISLAPRDRPLLQPARPAHPRSQAARRQADRRRHAAVEHRHPGRLLAGAGPGSEAAMLLAIAHHLIGRGATTASSCAAG